MASGHIRLGTPGALRDYLLVDPKRRTKMLANPMAAKLGSGLGNYDDLQNYAGWVMESWEAGISKREANAGGTLYSETDTRFANQLILPPYYDFEPSGLSATYTKVENMPSNVTTTLAVGPTAAAQYIAVKVTQSANADRITRMLVMLCGTNANITNGVFVNMSMVAYADVAGSPGGLALATGLVAMKAREAGYYWIETSTSTFTVAAGGVFWLVFAPYSGSIALPVEDHGTASATYKTYNGTAWVNSQYEPFFYAESHLSTNGTLGKIKKVTNYVDSLGNITPFFCLSDGSSQLSYYNSSGKVIRVGAPTSPVDMCAFGSTLYIANSGISDMQTYVSSTGVLATLAGIDANVLATWGGLLWRAYLNNVWYTNDGTTWTGPIQVGPSGYSVRGMAGLGQDMYVATDEALYMIGAADQVYGVTRWNNIAATNGVGMIHHQGAIYIPVGMDLLQYNGSQVLNMGINKEEGLPAFRQGRFVALTSHNYWLLGLLRAGENVAGEDINTVWAWNQQGWHFVCRLPTGYADSAAICWDVAHNALWVNSQSMGVQITLPRDFENPYRDAAGTAKFAPSGYIDTNWFYGGLKEVYKDWESVYISGENISASQYVEVYYQDDASTDWELLGTVTSNRQELRWSNPLTRPNSRQLKIRLILYTKSNSETPVVNAIRVKYMPMVMDRYRWSLPVTVSDNSQMLDGSTSPYTAAQIRAHLDSLITRVPPLIFEDVDELQYEVKVLSASEQVDRYERVNGRAVLKNVYSLTLEQVQSSTYGG